MEYEIIDTDQIPQELLDAFHNGQTIQIASCIGWLDCDPPPEFRCGNVYRVKKDN